MMEAVVSGMMLAVGRSHLDTWVCYHTQEHTVTVEDREEHGTLAGSSAMAAGMFVGMEPDHSAQIENLWVQMEEGQAV